MRCCEAAAPVAVPVPGAAAVRGGGGFTGSDGGWSVTGCFASVIRRNGVLPAAVDVALAVALALAVGVGVGV